MSFTLRRAEAGVAALLTLAAIWLRFVAATSGGALWRDEAGTVGLATLPSLRDVWSNLQHEAFPMLWLLMVRGFCGLVGPMNGPAFRALGFFVGVGVIGLLWFCARSFRQPYPLLSLALFAISPSVIVWGGSMRAYGFGVLLILLTGALLWRFVEQPGVRQFAAAAVSAIASVHVLFHNSVLLLAFCAGAVAVCVENRAWKKAGLVVLIGALAAVSLLPYVSAIRGASDWNVLVRMPDYTLAWFFMKLYETLSPVGFWAFFVWLALFWLALFVGVRIARFHSRLGLSQVEWEVALFSAVSLVVGAVGVFLFLNALSYPTAPWYYLPLLALAAVCMDALFGVRVRAQSARLARLVGVLIIAGATFFPAIGAVRARLTNVDLVASRVEAIAQPSDIVLVNKWYNGVSFDRYYRGQARWMTVPSIDVHRFHRYDLVKEKMMIADQTVSVRPVIDQIGDALRAGHRVFVVGGLLFPPMGTRPVVLRGAPLPGEPWPEDLYYREWSLMVGYFLQQHARKMAVAPVEIAGPISELENLPLWVAEGWRP